MRLAPEDFSAHRTVCLGLRYSCMVGCGTSSGLALFRRFPPRPHPAINSRYRGKCGTCDLRRWARGSLVRGLPHRALSHMRQASRIQCSHDVGQSAPERIVSLHHAGRYIAAVLLLRFEISAEETPDHKRGRQTACARLWPGLLSLNHRP